MKLYYTKGTCSFGPHIAMRELGIEPELVAVNLMEKKLADGSDYKAHNPKGYVPYIEITATSRGRGWACVSTT